MSFDVREHEIRAIIGPNGAGKSSMLNVINGVYHPQQGTIASRARRARDMDPHEAARAGHRAHLPEHRAVQGHDGARQHHDRPQPEDALQLPRSRRCGSGRRSARSSTHRAQVEEIIDFLEIQHIRKTPVGQPALRPAEARRAGARAGRRAAAPAARRADGRHEPRGKAGHVPLHPRRQRPVRHHHRPDRARHGRGDGPLRPRRGARLRPQDRRRHARRSPRRTRRSSTPTSASRTDEIERAIVLPRSAGRRPARRA